MAVSGSRLEPDPAAPLTRDDATAMVDALFCSTDAADLGAPTLGVEIELFTATPAGRRVRYERLVELVPDGLPGGGRITVEPGSQIELSTVPQRSLPALLNAIDTDLSALTDALDAAGIDHWAAGIDRARPPERTTDAPRYRFMEAELDRYSGAGRWMMTNTASLQINVANCHGDPTRRWRLLSRIGPLLTALFANSAGRSEDGRRWRSLRQGCWLAMDPRRAGMPPGSGRDPAADYLRYALAAPVLMVEGCDGSPVAPPPGLTVTRWLDGVDGLRAPLVRDFGYHLTTLFPPIRPRGWLEVRCLDAVERPLLDTAVAVVAALCAPGAMDEVERSIPDVPTFARAARWGLDDPTTAAAARRLVALSLEHARHAGWPLIAELEALARDLALGPAPVGPLPTDVATLHPPLGRAPLT